jgi:hypothetical protein
MARLRPLLQIILISTIVAGCALAQSNLTQIQDTVYNPDGSLFNGTLVITYTGTPNQGGNPAPYNTSAHIYNGVLSVLLVPSTTSNPPFYYQAVYSSNDGLTTWSELWQVPPSSTPLKLAQVRVSNTSGGGSGTQVQISQVIGLTSDLAAINSSLSTLTSSIASINSSVTTLSSKVNALTALVNGLAPASINVGFVDAEAPVGLINGTNATFTLANLPSAGTAVSVYRNGVHLDSGVDYTITGPTITFLSGQIPQLGDIVLAYYRINATSATPMFVDSETPSGTINGTNTVFHLAAIPAPALSLRLYKNGILLQENVDYVLSGNTITFSSQGITPQTGDILLAYYRSSIS